MYKELLKKSWHSIKPVLFIPDLIFVVITLIVLLTTIFTSGLFAFLSYGIFAKAEEFPKLFLDFTRANPLRFIISLVTFFIVTFIVGVSTTSMRLAIIRDIINGKKVKFNLNYGKDYFWRVVRLKVLIFLTTIAIILFGLIWISFINYFKLGIWLIVLGILITLFLLILFFMVVLFRYPIMIINNKNAVVTLTESLYYTIRNKKHILIVILLLFLIGVIFSFSTSIISKLTDLIISLAKTSTIGFFILISGIMINVLIDITFLILKDLFLFYNFKNKKTIY